ncbi:hypothetical protein KU6B_48530 [Mameliella alba]|nr:hypothetical protein KU6B_48530 [Mameliella alba]
MKGPQKSGFVRRGRAAAGCQDQKGKEGNAHDVRLAGGGSLGKQQWPALGLSGFGRVDVIGGSGK